jgi:hypothetical protein
MRRAEHDQRVGDRLCPRCQQAMMVEVVSIAPLAHEPGLIAFECNSCGHVSSDLQPPSEGE